MARIQDLTDNRKSFDEVVVIGNGLIDPRKPEFQGSLHVGPDNISGESGRVLHPLQTARELGLKSGKFPFQAGDILYSKIRPNLNKVAIADVDGICSADMYVLKPKGIDRSFLFHSLRGELFYRQAVAASMRSGLPKVNRDDLSMMELKVPPLSEQRRIAAILDEWDRAIATAEKLADSKTIRKNGIQGELVAQIDKLAKSHVELRTLSREVTRKNDGTDHPIMTIGSKDGYILQSKRYSRDMTGKSLENYTLLNRGEFSYNKGNSKSYPQGCIYRLHQNSALVPNVYISFAMHVSDTASFYETLFEAGYLNRQLSRLINSGVRNDGLLNIGSDDFFSCTIPVVAEGLREKFSAALRESSVDVSAAFHQAKLLRLQKRGLMQKLLSGDWPVPASIDRLLPGGLEVDEVVRAEVQRAEATG